MLRLTTLGAIDLRDDRGHPIRDVLRQPKRLALLVYLTLESRRAPVSREKLLALFWPESDTEHARNALSQLLHQLRVSLGRDLFESDGATHISLGKSALWCDAAEFEELLSRGEMDVALDLYRGEFCPALHANASPELDQWLDERRRHLSARAVNAITSLAKELARRGERDGAVRLARRALAQQSDDEAEVRSLLSLLETLGDSTGALQAYESYARRLEAELETQPDPATQRVADTIRSNRERAANAHAAARAQGTAVVAPHEELATATASLAPSAPAYGNGAARRRPRWMRASMLGVAALLLSVSMALALRVRDPAIERASRTIAVFPFTVGGDTTLAHLSRGMVDLLSAKLDGAVGWHAIDPRSAIGALQRSTDTTAPDRYRRLAQQLGAGRYLIGDLVGLGAQMHLNAALHDVESGEVVASASVTGPVDSLLSLVDGLTGRLLSRVTLGRDRALTQLAAVTTPSLPAVLAFLSGEEALRAGRDAEAVAAFRDAVAIDSSFALAWYRLSSTSTWSTTPDVGDPGANAEAAVRHSTRLTPLARDLLGAYVAYRSLRADEAERSYLATATSRPDNIEAWYMLGETRFHFSHFRGRTAYESVEPFRRVLALDPGNPHVLIHLARLAALAGQVAELDSLVATYLAAYPSAPRALEMRALAAFVRGNAADRAAILVAARNADGTVWMSLLQAAATVAQNFDAAVELAPYFARTLHQSYYRSVAGRALSDLALGRGQLSSRAQERLAGALFDPAWSLESRALVAANRWFALGEEAIIALRDSVASHTLDPTLTQTRDSVDGRYGSLMQQYLVGALSVRVGDTLRVARAITELAGIGRENPELAPAGSELARSLRADLLRARGDQRAALEELERFRPQAIPRSLFGVAHWGTRERFNRAELLLELGRFEDALQIYASFESLWDLPYLAPSHLRRAEINERLGNRERAIFHYRRFVDMWRDCDPVLRPIVARANQSLTRLGSSAR